MGPSDGPAGCDLLQRVAGFLDLYRVREMVAVLRIPSWPDCYGVNRGPWTDSELALGVGPAP